MRVSRLKKIEKGAARCFCNGLRWIMQNERRGIFSTKHKGGKPCRNQMEKIKYHDNTVYPQYGEDHRLLDNWDPDADYGNEFANVHFRIETPTYCFPAFTFTPEQREAFYKETGRIFTALGWEVKENPHSGSAMSAASRKPCLKLRYSPCAGSMCMRHCMTGRMTNMLHF